MHLITKKEIEKAIHIPSLIEEIEKGFVYYSKRQAISSLSFLHFENPPGDVHIKAGSLLDDTHYVVKVASSFYENPTLGLPSSNGLMLLFSKISGQLEAILQDEGMLTDLRTGLAGAVAAKYLAPNPIARIGIIGTGTQAREQLYNLQFITDCRTVSVWGRDPAKALAFANDPLLSSFKIEPSSHIDELADQCNLIITTTASSKPLLFGTQIKPGTHITAVGADGEGKQELDPTIFERADLISLDSLHQCSKYGDFSYAKHLSLKAVMELGELIANPPIRPNNAITVTDLTGVAVQDLQIAKAVYKTLLTNSDFK